MTLTFFRNTGIASLALTLCVSFNVYAHQQHDHHGDEKEEEITRHVDSPVLPTEYKSQVIRERDAETFRESPDLNKMTVLWGNDYNLGAMSAVVETLGPGKKIPLHIHKNAEEMIYILHGKGNEILGDMVNPVRKGDLVLITPGTVHGLENTGDGPLKYFIVYNTNEMMQFFRDYSFKNRKDVEERFTFEFLVNLFTKHSYHFALPPEPQQPTVQIPFKADK